MSSRLPSRFRIHALLVLALPLALSALAVLHLPAAAAEEAEEVPTAMVAVGAWLAAGPVAAPLPAFAEEIRFGEEEPVTPRALLLERPRDAQEPRPEPAVVWPGGERTEWRAVSRGTVEIGEGGGSVHGSPTWRAMPR